MQINKTGLAVRLAALFVVSFTITLPAGAQNRSSSGADEPAAGAASTIMNPDRAEALARVFEAPGLRVGDRFPAVDIFDEAGQTFNTGNLRGRYTVVINGCLT